MGSQSVNWSEHIYPLVAALDESGHPGAGYEISRKNLGTVLARAEAAERKLAEAIEATRHFLDHYAITPGSLAWERSADLRETIDRIASSGGNP